MTVDQMVTAVLRRLGETGASVDEDVLRSDEIQAELFLAAQDLVVTAFGHGYVFSPKTVNLQPSTLTKLDGTTNTDATSTSANDEWDLWSPSVVSFRTTMGLLLAERIDGSYATDPQTCDFPRGGNFRHKNEVRAGPWGNEERLHWGPRMYLRGNRYLGFVDTHDAATVIRVHYAPSARDITSQTGTSSWTTFGNPGTEEFVVLPPESDELIIQKALVQCFGLDNDSLASQRARQREGQLELRYIQSFTRRFAQDRRVRAGVF